MHLAHISSFPHPCGIQARAPQASYRRLPSAEKTPASIVEMEFSFSQSLLGKRQGRRARRKGREEKPTPNRQRGESHTSSSSSSSSSSPLHPCRCAHPLALSFSCPFLPCSLCVPLAPSSVCLLFADSESKTNLASPQHTPTYTPVYTHTQAHNHIHT